MTTRSEILSNQKPWSSEAPIKQNKKPSHVPLTAILIIIPNFITILPLASSFGPLTCFTFDHLLCPAHKAGHSCSVRAGGVLHPEDTTHEDGGRTGSRDGNLLEAADTGGRRALNSSSTGAAMPFTHTQTHNYNECSCCTCGAKTTFNEWAESLSLRERALNFAVTTVNNKNCLKFSNLRADKSGEHAAASALVVRPVLPGWDDVGIGPVKIKAV